MNDEALSAEVIAGVAQKAHDATFQGSRELHPMAGLWAALETLLRASPDLRRDALALMDHETLVLLAAQAEVEWRLAGTGTAVSEIPLKALYHDAVSRSDDELYDSIRANVERLAGSGWSPPWPDRDDDEADE